MKDKLWLIPIAGAIVYVAACALAVLGILSVVALIAGPIGMAMIVAGFMWIDEKADRARLSAPEEAEA